MRTMTMALLMIAGTAAAAPSWHWSPPKTGSPVVLYTVDVRDAWGVRVMLASTADTTWTPPPWLDHVAHHIAVEPMDAELRPGTPSLWSEAFLPREWAGLWWVMGAATRTAPLSMVVAGYQATAAAFPDSLREDRP